MICIASMLLSSAIVLVFPGNGPADPKDPSGGENRRMLVQLSSALFWVLLVFGLITMFSSS